MATLVDESSSASHGSYFDLLAEKYPDLAPEKPAARPAERSVAPSEAPVTPETVPPPSSRAAEAPSLTTLLLVLLGIALIFPPALLWRPSWLPNQGLEGAVLDPQSSALEAVPELSVPKAAVYPASDEVRSLGSSESQMAEAGRPANDFSPVEPSISGEPSSSAEQSSAGSPGQEAILPVVIVRAPEATASPPAAGTASEDTPRAVLIEVSPVRQAAAAPETVSERPVDAGHALPRRVESTNVLEVATAGPRIRPARRLDAIPPTVIEEQPRSQTARLRLRAHISPLGEVIGVDVLQGLSREVDRQLAANVQQWRYAPATVDGRAVSSQQEIVLVLPPIGLVELAASEPIEPARRRLSPLPVYTDEAWSQGTEGEVELLARIDTAGKVTDVEVVRGLPHGLTQAAVHAVETWRFDPARQRGAAIDSRQRLKLRFAL